MGARQALAPNLMGARQALAPKVRRSGLPVWTDPGRISGGCGWGTTPPGDGGLMTMDADRLDGRVALVTGAGSPEGIGYATAARLRGLGAAVAIVSTTKR